MQGGVGSGGAVELEVHRILHQPTGGGRDHGLNVGVDPLLALLRSELPVLVEHLRAAGHHQASLQPHGSVAVGGQDVPQLLHMLVVHIAHWVMSSSSSVRVRFSMDEGLCTVHGADRGDEVPGEDGGEVARGQADVALLEVGVDPGLGAGEGLAGELGEGAAGVGPAAGTHGTELALCGLPVTLTLQHTCGISETELCVMCCVKLYV